MLRSPMTTIKNQHELTTGEILDVCDVHLAFLRPGIFGELKLKKALWHNADTII